MKIFLFLVTAIGAAALFTAGPGMSLALLSLGLLGAFFCKMLPSLTDGQKAAVLSLSLAVSAHFLGILTLPMLAVIVAGSFFLCQPLEGKIKMTSCALVAGLMGVMLASVAEAAGGLEGTLTSFGSLATKGKETVKLVAEVGGIGVGAAGIRDMYRSRNQEGGDMTKGGIKLLAGGGLFGVAQLVESSKTSVVGG